MTVKLGGFSPALDTKVSLTEEEFNSVKAKMKDALVTMLPQINEAIYQIAETNKKITENNREIKAAQEMQAEGRAMQAEGRAMQAEGRAMQAEGRAMQARGVQGLQEVAKERQDIITRQFYSIFKGKDDLAAKDLPALEVDRLFKTYLANGSLTVEKSAEGTSFGRINSMKAVIQYLEDNPNVLTLDFRSFKTEVHDISALADNLKTSTVKAIALKKGISDDAKASLAEAVAARNGTLYGPLKVQYFD
jgi:ABC-type phosphate transport system auxiliary subunit